MKQTANKLINKNNKLWLADKLGISRPTLDTRLELDNWKKSEIQMLLILDK
jgi:hypothetical protein